MAQLKDPLICHGVNGHFFLSNLVTRTVAEKRSVFVLFQ